MSKQISTMTGVRGDIAIRQFFGGDKIGLCVQITQQQSSVLLSTMEARGLANSLLKWADTISTKTLETRWFSFGQYHTHSVAGVTYDKDCIVEITSFSARKTMFETFGPKWAMEYDKLPDMSYYPRGVFKLN